MNEIDLKYSFRQLTRSPGFALVAVVTPGLGIGANTAVFILLNSVLLRSLPVNNPEALRSALVMATLGVMIGLPLVCVLRKGAVLTSIGLALGLCLSCLPFWILTRLVPESHTFNEEALYGVHLWDPLTYGCVTLLVSPIMLGACWFPARRAAGIDPMEALRYE